MSESLIPFHFYNLFTKNVSIIHSFSHIDKDTAKRSNRLQGEFKWLVCSLEQHE